MATATIPASGPDRRWRALNFSASITAGTAVLQIISDDTAIGGGQVVVYERDVTPTNPIDEDFQPIGMLMPKPNATMIASLSNPGVGNTGRVNLHAVMDQ